MLGYDKESIEVLEIGEYKSGCDSKSLEPVCHFRDIEN